MKATPMKKLLVLAFSAATVLTLKRRLDAQKAEQDLWAEATDPVV